MRRVVLLTLTVAMIGGVFTSEASANYLTDARAKAAVGPAVEMNQEQAGYSASATILTCSRVSEHQVTCTVNVDRQIDDDSTDHFDSQCTGSVAVVLSHTSGRTRAVVKLRCPGYTLPPGGPPPSVPAP